MKALRGLGLRLMVMGVTLGSPLLAHALEQAPQSGTEFCALAKDSSRFRALAGDQENRLSFENGGGIINGGVCWWHSRLQRSATYLSVYRPDLPKPSRSHVKWILKQWAGRKQVVEVPGYASLSEFSHDWQSTIQKYLEGWQRKDGILRFAWIRGLANSPRANAKKLETTMLKLEREVMELERITYLKVQIPGIVSHAWLVIDVARTGSGLELLIIDSNRLDLVSYHYRWGDDRISSYDGFMPYIEQRKDYRRIDGAIYSYCASREDSRQSGRYRHLLKNEKDYQDDEEDEGQAEADVEF